jgi:hypothetical protein
MFSLISSKRDCATGRISSALNFLHIPPGPWPAKLFSHFSFIGSMPWISRPTVDAYVTANQKMRGRMTTHTLYRDVIIALAAPHKLPAVYPYSDMVTDGGLISYAPDLIDQLRHAASYVDRILNGEKPADLPVQAPTKYELVINLKAAKALGLTIPPSLLTTADAVIDWAAFRCSAYVASWAQSRRPDRVSECPLSGVKRTS